MPDTDQIAKKRLKKSRNFKYRYGITLEEWSKLLKKQRYRCAACRTDKPGTRGWVIDHCHKTVFPGRAKHVRGILCQGCNIALGHVKDSPKRLRMLANYLENSRLHRRKK